MTESIRILMCAPDHYDVDYVINPWMEGNIHKSSRDRAVEQWQKLDLKVSERLAGVKLGGKSLLTPDSGILCPIPDCQGKFTSWQLRL